jgi:hypothetical protein
MTRKQKTIEEQLAEARAVQQRAKARLDELEVKRKTRDHRLRMQGERVVLRIVLSHMATHAAFKETICNLVAKAELREGEREAALWLLDALGQDANDRTREPAA